MSYCGSEMGESEIYSPYSFCGSEAGLDVAQGDPNDNGYQTTSRSNKTVSRLRMRKGRSVVHTNLEDNYSAVIVANHEALAQVLDQVKLPHLIRDPFLNRTFAISASTTAHNFTCFASHRELSKSSLRRFYDNWLDWTRGWQKRLPSSHLAKFRLCHTRLDIRLKSNGVGRLQWTQSDERWRVRRT